MTQHTFTAGALGALAIVATACTGGGSGDFGTVNGRVEDQGSNQARTAAASLEGAVVTAQRVEADGSLTPVFDAEATTSANGDYQLDVLLDRGAERDLLIEATHESAADGRVILSGSLAPGAELTAAPIDLETTVEGDVYVDIAAQGNWDADSSSALLRQWISADLAAELDASADYSGAVSATARADASAMAAWSSMLEDQTIGATSADVEAAAMAAAEARAAADADLDAAASADEESAAQDAFFEGMIQAYADAGIDVGDLALAVQASSDASIDYAAQLSGDARARAIADAEQFRAALVRRAVEARFEVIGASQASLDAVATAGDDLEAKLEATADAGAQASAEAETAWSGYRAAIESELETTLEVGTQAALAEVRDTVTTASQSLESALAQLELGASVSATAEATVDAYGAFYAEVFADANVSTMTSAGMNADNARATLEILATIQAAAAAG